MKVLTLPVAIFALSSVLAFGQPWSGIIDPSRATNWATNGVGATITNRPTICSTSACAALTGSGVTGANITAAIASAPANSVVLLPAGTFSISGISDKGSSNITLRGAGPGHTILNFTGVASACNADICVIDSAGEWFSGSTPTQPGGSNAAQVSSGYTQGSNQIVVNTIGKSGLSVGTMIIMDQADDTSVGSGLFVCDQDTTAPYCHQSSQTGSYNGSVIGGVDYNQSQVFIIRAINTSSPYSSSSPLLSLSNPVYGTNWRSSQNVGIWWPSTAVIQGVGIEDMTLNHTRSTSAQAGIQFYDCYNCWVKNIVDTNTNRDHVYFYQTKNITVRDSYFFGTQNETSVSYGIEDLLSSDYLIENNIFQQIAAPVIGAGGSGGVMGYNFWINNLYQPGSTPKWNEAAFMAHDAGNEMKLMEGNEGASINLDDIHGMGGLNTFFRNQLSGRGYNGATSPATLTTNNTNAFNVYYGWRGENIIGNVMGYGGYFTIYQTGTTGSGGQTACNASIFAMGWGWSNCEVDPGGSSYPQKDTLVESTMLRWGNYDTVTGGVRWCGSTPLPSYCTNGSEIPTTAVTYINANPVPSSTTLPNSFYLAGQPSWWQFPSGPASPFPAIGPDVTGGTMTAGTSSLGGHAYPNPAMNCYFNVMGGSSDGSGSVITTFNANTCYGGASGPPAPTGITAVVH